MIVVCFNGRCSQMFGLCLNAGWADLESEISSSFQLHLSFSVFSLDNKAKPDESWLVSCLLKALLASETLRFGPACVWVSPATFSFPANTFCVAGVADCRYFTDTEEAGQSSCMFAWWCCRPTFFCSVAKTCGFLSRKSEDSLTVWRQMICLMLCYLCSFKTLCCQIWICNLILLLMSCI